MTSNSLFLRILVSSIAVTAPFALAGLAGALHAGTHGAETLVVDRTEGIGNAFASLPQISVDAAIAPAATRLSKGDLPHAVGCPSAPSCLSTAGRSPAPHVRTITIGYQAGANTTVIVRIPAEELAGH